MGISASGAAPAVATETVTEVTPGVLTVATDPPCGVVASRFTWTAAQVIALSGTANTLKVCTLPARTVVLGALLRISTAETVLTALTASLGRTGANYIDYIVASNAKAVAIYGLLAAALGTNLATVDLPSVSATTDVFVRFDGALENLSAGSGCAGEVTLFHVTV